MPNIIANIDKSILIEVSQVTSVEFVISESIQRRFIIHPVPESNILSLGYDLTNIPRVYR